MGSNGLNEDRVQQFAGKGGGGGVVVAAVVVSGVTTGVKTLMEIIQMCLSGGISANPAAAVA